MSDYNDEEERKRSEGGRKIVVRNSKFLFHGASAEVDIAHEAIACAVGDFKVVWMSSGRGL